MKTMFRRILLAVTLMTHVAGALPAVAVEAEAVEDAPGR